MIELTRPELVFERQKVYIPRIVEGNETTTGIEAKAGTEVVILFSQPISEKLNGEERNQLVKIVAACKLNEDDIVLVNTAFVPNVSLSWLRKNFPVKTVILFGDISVGKNMILKKYFAYSIDGVKIVRSEPLTKLLTSSGDKKALWDELRKVFAIA